MACQDMDYSPVRCSVDLAAGVVRPKIVKWSSIMSQMQLIHSVVDEWGILPCRAQLYSMCLSEALRFITMTSVLIGSTFLILTCCSTSDYLGYYVQVWEGLGVVATGRQMLGETDPVSDS